MTDRLALVVAFSALIVAVVAAAYAKKSANAAETVARAEKDRDHRDNEPKLNGEFVIENQALWYEFRLDRPYSMLYRTTVYGRGNDGIPGMRTADRMWRIMIETWPGGRPPAPPCETLEIRFWPPEPQADEPLPWTCPCGRGSEVNVGPGHWKWTLGVPQHSSAIVNRDLPGPRTD